MERSLYVCRRAPAETVLLIGSGNACGPQMVNMLDMRLNWRKKHSNRQSDQVREIFLSKYSTIDREDLAAFP